MTGTRCEIIPPAEAKQQLAKFLSTCSPLVNTGYVPIDGRHLPIAVVDAVGRPDLLDLVRIYASEGIGDHIATFDVAFGTSVLVVLKIELERPVRCVFRVAFEVADHRAWLENALRTGILVTAFTRGRLIKPKNIGAIVWEIGHDHDALSTALLFDALRAGRTAAR